MKLTLNQKRVLEALRQARCPLGAYALLSQLRQPGFTAPTQVYRALEKLMQHGLVHRLESLNAYVSCAHGCHHGFTAFAICDNCGHIDEFVDDALNTSLGRWIENQNFALGRTSIEIHGKCSVCAANRTIPHEHATASDKQGYPPL